MLVHLRSFMTVVEEGSLHRAAEPLHLSQSALSRQMQALEAELGGQLLERTSTGVRPTNGGHAQAAKANTLLASCEATIVEVRRLLRGESEQLRIGYGGSAARDYLDPALAKLRQTYPAARLQLLDFRPASKSSRSAAARFYTPGGAYLNFMTEEEADWIKASCRAKYARLTEITRRCDPDNFIRIKGFSFENA